MNATLCLLVYFFLTNSGLHGKEVSFLSSMPIRTCPSHRERSLEANLSEVTSNCNLAQELNKTMGEEIVKTSLGYKSVE